MLNIKILDFSSEAASKTKGLHLRELMIPLLSENKNFAVDFEGIYRFASPFFNNSFASLALIYGFDSIKKIPLLNISKIGQQAFDTSLDNAQLLSTNPEYVEKINTIINENLPKKDV